MFSQHLIGPVRTGDMATEDIDIFDLNATAPVYKKNFAEGGEAKTVDPNVQEVKEILKSAGINKLYQAADSLGIRLPDGIGVDSAADVITNELLFRANIPVRKKDDTFTLEKSLGKGISFRADVNPKQKSGFLNISGRFNEGGIAAKDIDIFDEEPSGVQKISKLISDGQVREAYSEFEKLPLVQQLTVSVTPVIGDALAAYEVGEFGTRAKESLSRGSPLGAAGNVALAGLAGLSFIPFLRALRGARPFAKAVASTSETIPGPTTGQLTGITDLPADVRTEYSKAIYSDPRTGEMLKKDPIYKALDMPQKDVFEGQGFYKDEFNPVFVSRPVPRVKKDATGIERIDPRDAKTIEQRDTTFGYLTQQEGTPTSRVLTKAAPGTNDTIKITTKADISQTQFAKIAKEAGKYGLDPVSIPEGITFFNNKSFDVLEDLPPQVVDDLTESIEEILGPTAIRRLDRGNFDSINYSDFSEEFSKSAGELADTSSLATKKLFESLDNKAIAKLDKSPEVRRFVTNKLEKDLEIARKQDLPIRKDIRTALTIISDQGFAGLKKVMDKGEVILPGILYLYLGKAIPMVSSETQSSEA